MSPKDQSPIDLTTEDIEIKFADYLSDHMSETEKAEFENWLSKHPKANLKSSELKLFSEQLNAYGQQAIPEPTEQMDQRFYDMLSKEENINNEVKAHWSVSLFNWFKLPKVQKFAYGMSFMVVGLFIGHYAHLINQQTTFETDQISMKNQQIQALAVLSMLDMPSANKRIMAVQLAGMNSTPNNNIFDALLGTLEQDDNVNVRLEALSVLASHSDNQQVRSGLIEAINYQDSPMVQIALTNLMLLLEEKQAIQPIKQLIEKPEVLDSVKSQLNQTLNELI